jgi:hypothetical protein
MPGTRIAGQRHFFTGPLSSPSDTQRRPAATPGAWAQGVSLIAQCSPWQAPQRLREGMACGDSPNVRVQNIRRRGSPYFRRPVRRRGAALRAHHLPPRVVGANLSELSERSSFMHLSRIPEATPGKRNVAITDAINSKTPLQDLVGGIGTLATDKPNKTVGSFWPYATTLFDYIRRAMPYYAPGSLSVDDTFAVTAYILNLNGIIPDDLKLDQDSLPKVTMPNRDGFFTDPELVGFKTR